MTQKNDFYDENAEVLKALSNSTRLKIICLLSKNKCNVVSIEASLGIKQSNISRQLFVLKSAGIVKGEREGNEIFYEIINEKVIRLVNCLEKYELTCTFCGTNHEVFQYRGYTICADCLNNIIHISKQ